jgi:general stress protein 26
MTEKEQIKKFHEIIQDIKFAMMTTAEKDGSLHSRPMACVISKDSQMNQNELWFFTRKSSGKVKAIDQDQHVNLAYSDPSHSRYVSVSGRAELVTDRKKIEEFWSPILKAWFPDGLKDPELALLKVSFESAEYWDTPSSKLVRLVGFAKAVTTGKPYKPGEKEHGRVHT